MTTNRRLAAILAADVAGIAVSWVRKGLAQTDTLE